MSTSTVTPSVLSSISSVPMDWTIIGIFVFVVATLTAVYGARYACSIALAMVFAGFATAFIGRSFLIEGFADTAASTLATIPFAVLFVLFLFTFVRIVGYDGAGSVPFVAAIAGIACAAIVVTVWLSTPALQSLYAFGPQAQIIFGEGYRLYWLLGSVLALAFSRS